MRISGPPGPSWSSPGAGPAPKTARSRTRARTTQGIDFWPKLLPKAVGSDTTGWFKFFPDLQDHLGSELKVRQNPRTSSRSVPWAKIRTSSQFRSSLTKGTSSRSRSLNRSFLAVLYSHIFLTE